MHFHLLFRLKNTFYFNFFLSVVLEQYVYKSDGTDFLKEAEPVDLRLLDVKYNVQKRDVQQTIAQPPTSRTLPIQQQPINESERVLLDRTHRKSLNTMNKVLLSLPVNYTKTMPTNIPSRNLGENGSGIFLNLSSTTPASPLSGHIDLTAETNSITKENPPADPDMDEVAMDGMYDMVTSFDKYVNENNYIVNKSVSISNCSSNCINTIRGYIFNYEIVFSYASDWI